MWTSMSAMLLGLQMVCGAAGAEGFASLGYREDTVIQGDGSDECAGTLVHNHDYSFENGYCWQLGGVVPPYYGAFAEGYDLGAVTVECAVYWFTQIGYPLYQPIDVYVWDGGVSGAPTSVLCVAPDIYPPNLPFWPSCGENDIEIACCVTGHFAVGYWGNWPGQTPCPYYCCADESGPGGHPWTCIAPGLGYPTGWQHPNVVFPDCVSMGIGVTVTEVPSPAESVTWRTIKSLFRGASR